MNTSEENTYSVYMHVFPNDKVYIGMTVNEPEYRWKSTGSGYKGQPLMWRAIQKYGWHNVQHIVLATHLTRNEAEHMERAYIGMYSSNKREHGYNIDNGGQGNGRMSQCTKDRLSKIKTGTKMSEEAKKKMSIAQTGRKHTPETLAKMSASQKGKRCSTETKKKLSEIRKQMGYSKETIDKMCEIIRRPVLQISIETGNIIARYDSETSAAKEFGLDRSRISACATGKQNKMAGYVWVFEDEATDDFIMSRLERARTIKNAYVAKMNLGDEVVCVYSTTTMAAKLNDMPRPSLRNRIASKKIVDNHYFKYISFSDFEYYKSLGLLCEI